MAVLMRSSSSSIKVKDGSFPIHKKVPNTLPTTGFVRYLRNDEFVLRLSTRHSRSHRRMILPVFVSSSSSSSNPQSEETSVQDFNGTSSFSSDGDTATANHVQVRFQLQRECVFGERFHIVGDDPKLGSWDPTCSIPMDWSEGHVWTVGLDDMPARKKIQFKFILLNGGSENITWQPGPDRILHTWETAKTITVCEDWDDDQLQTVFEEEIDLVFKNETNLLTIEDNISAEEAVLVENIHMDINDVEEPISFLEQDLTQINTTVIFKNLESREDDHIILVPRESTPVLVPGLIPFSNENTTEEEDDDDDDDERAAADTIKVAEGEIL